MGYASYTITRRGEEIEAGYAVPDICNKEGCSEEIDRGLAFLCGQHPGGDEYGCGGYFCYSHLLLSVEEGVPQRCEACFDAADSDGSEASEEAGVDTLARGGAPS
jgi:hypothetical protein